jgi:hypothetical protein
MLEGEEQRNFYGVGIGDVVVGGGVHGRTEEGILWCRL